MAHTAHHINPTIIKKKYAQHQKLALDRGRKCKQLTGRKLSRTMAMAEARVRPDFTSLEFTTVEPATSLVGGPAAPAPGAKGASPCHGRGPGPPRFRAPERVCPAMAEASATSPHLAPPWLPLRRGVGASAPPP